MGQWEWSRDKFEEVKMADLKQVRNKSTAPVSLVLYMGRMHHRPRWKSNLQLYVNVCIRILCTSTSVQYINNLWRE